jgi:hypothetical protein
MGRDVKEIVLTGDWLWREVTALPMSPQKCQFEWQRKEERELEREMRLPFSDENEQEHESSFAEELDSIEERERWKPMASVIVIGSVKR